MLIAANTRIMIDALTQRKLKPNKRNTYIRLIHIQSNPLSNLITISFTKPFYHTLHNRRPLKPLKFHQNLARCDEIRINHLMRVDAYYTNKQHTLRVSSRYAEPEFRFLAGICRRRRSVGELSSCKFSFISNTLCTANQNIVQGALIA